MDSVRNPSDDESVADWFNGIGKATENEAPWKAFAKSISAHTAASTVGLLRQVRDADIDTALASANLSIGFKNALCEYLVPRGGKPYQFVKPDVHEARRRSANKQGVQGKYQKKFPSQQHRLTLGRELGDQLSTLQLPETLLASIKHSKEVQMKSKGKNSTERVADLILMWVVGRWATVHIDCMFADRMEELLNEQFPLLQPWGAKTEHPRPRRWSEIIMNRFANLREAKDNAYQNLAIPEVDLSSPSKKLLDDGLKLKVKCDVASMYELVPNQADQDKEEIPEEQVLSQGDLGFNKQAGKRKLHSPQATITKKNIKKPRQAVLQSDSSDAEAEFHRSPEPVRKEQVMSKPAPKKTTVQTKFKFKISIKELTVDDPLVLAVPVEPQLNESNAVGRFVYIPPEEFGGSSDVGGWTAKIMALSSQKVASLKFHDGLQYFPLAYVCAKFKAVS